MSRLLQVIAQPSHPLFLSEPTALPELVPRDLSVNESKYVVVERGQGVDLGRGVEAKPSEDAHGGLGILLGLRPKPGLDTEQHRPGVPAQHRMGIACEGPQIGPPIPRRQLG